MMMRISDDDKFICYKVSNVKTEKLLCIIE